MADIINDVLKILRRAESPETQWKNILERCKKGCPSPAWSRLPKPEVTEDVERASRWLAQAFDACPHPVRGVYLGLDTLNMRAGRGKNVEIAINGRADPSSDDVDWIYDRENNWYGKDHLIRSLVPMKREYTKSHWEGVSPDPDYLVFLAYSGVILAPAIEAASANFDVVVVWGFHDGDLLTLARRTKGKYKRVAK